MFRPVLIAFVCGVFVLVSAALATAMELKVNSVCNAVMTTRAVDHFSFEAKKGQRIGVECATRGIDSKLDAVVIIGDSAGREGGFDQIHEGRRPADVVVGLGSDRKVGPDLVGVDESLVDIEMMIHLQPVAVLLGERIQFGSKDRGRGVAGHREEF